MEEKIYGLLGRKLGHSWSVPIHRELGNAAYRLIELEPDALGAFLRREDIGGLNVTIPYKRAVMEHCDEIDEAALAVGSVNTLVRRDGKLKAYNTDVLGFRYMAEQAGVSPAGRKVLILGGGGASLTAQAQSRRMGAREVTVISRSGADNYENLDRHSDAEIVVNTTPVGMYPDTGAAAVDLKRFPQCRGVLDLIYNPQRTALLMQAEELGIPCSGGLAMLVAQATAAEELFFNRTIPDGENGRILRLLRRDQTNLVLIGMPGCGKSSVGMALAALTGREAVDVDAAIESRAGSSIPAIFDTQGEEVFRALEREETARLGKESGKILITGGGVVKDSRNYPALHQNGRIYQLCRATEQLARAGRPLSQNGDLSTLERERAPLYARFRDVQIDNNGTVADAAAAIWSDFCENFDTERA